MSMQIFKNAIEINLKSYCPFPRRNAQVENEFKKERKSMALSSETQNNTLQVGMQFCNFSKDNDKIVKMAHKDSDSGRN